MDHNGCRDSRYSSSVCRDRGHKDRNDYKDHRDHRDHRSCRGLRSFRDQTGRRVHNNHKDRKEGKHVGNAGTDRIDGFLRDQVGRLVWRLKKAPKNLQGAQADVWQHKK